VKKEQSTLVNKVVDITTTDNQTNQPDIQKSAVVKIEPMDTSTTNKVHAKKPEEFTGNSKSDVEIWVKQIEIYCNRIRFYYHSDLYAIW
jgi:hypothetical protein